MVTDEYIVPQQHFTELRKELIKACISAGIGVPVSVPIPGLPAHIGTMIASRFGVLQAPAPMPILPVD